MPHSNVRAERGLQVHNELLNPWIVNLSEMRHVHDHDHSECEQMKLGFIPILITCGEALKNQAAISLLLNEVGQQVVLLLEGAVCEEESEVVGRLVIKHLDDELGIEHGVQELHADRLNVILSERVHRIDPRQHFKDRAEQCLDVSYSLTIPRDSLNRMKCRQVVLDLLVECY